MGLQHFSARALVGGAARPSARRAGSGPRRVGVPRIRYHAVTMLLLLALACDTTEPSPPSGDGLFAAGCPVAGRAHARELRVAGERPWGPEALAAPGDVLLVNEVAAFVIQGVADPRTYYHYGGAPIDAVAVRGCEQAGPELLEEVGFTVGQLDLGDFDQSTLHQVRGTAVRIVADGTDGGPAVVEVDAVDDRFWLVEMTLVRNVWASGGRKELGPLFGLELTLRYTLEPASSVLEVEVQLGGEPVTDGFLVGALVFPSDELETVAYAQDALAFGGFSLDVGVPWLGMGGAEGSQAIAMPDAVMAYTEVSGVRALLDLAHAGEPLLVGGAAVPPATRFLIGVGATDGASASAAFEPWLPEPVAGAGWGDVSGVVRGPDGPVGGASVALELATDEGAVGVIETLVTDAEGHFSGRVPVTDGWTAVATAPGRDASVPVELRAGAPATIEMGAAGAVDWAIVDADGAGAPGRLVLTRDDGARVEHFGVPGDVVPVAPGTWSAMVSRGYEWAPASGTLVVPEGGSATAALVLERALDTAGWASVDTHVHAEASADSTTLAGDRMRSAVASGLDVVVSTDHEAIVDLQPALDGAGLGDWLAYGLGSEITATIPEHVNAWPFPVREQERGEPVRWQQLGFGGVFSAARARGARVVQLNHSRVNGECGILCILDWDRGAADPATADARGLALPEGTEVWSWDFDTFEVINGLRSPLLDPADPRHTGALVDWMAFLNLGHRVTGVAVTDVHGRHIPGEPRSYVRVASDTAGTVSADDVADGELDGAAQMSAGGFAQVSIAGAGPGDLATVLDGHATLALRVQALAEIDVTEVHVLVNCDAAAVVATTAPWEVVKVDTTVPLELDADAHIVVVAFGEAPMPLSFDDYDPRTLPRVITNPIYVDVDGDGAWTAPGAKPCTTGLDLPR